MTTAKQAAKYVALLRGVNVGRAKRVSMTDLRALVEGLGYTEVRTLLNSGNVVFTAKGAPKGDPASRIEKALATKIGVSSRVTVLNAAELAAIVKDNPLLEAADNPSRFLVAVLNDKSNRKRLEPLLEQDWSPDRFGLGGRVAYMWCPEGILANRLAETVGKLLGDGVTARNWATILKLHALTKEER